MAIYKKVTDLVGNTPILELGNYEEKNQLEATILAKLEYFNPAGSVKDRIAREIILDALETGKLTKDSVIIEPTSGNTGIGLASIAAAKGYRIILTMPETMSVERRNILKAYGAEIVLTEGAKGMKGAIAKAEELAKEIPGSFIPSQFTNPANVQAHFETTGPEIWADTDGKVDIFVAGVGTGGTVTGVGQYLKSQNKDVKVVAGAGDNAAAAVGTGTVGDGQCNISLGTSGTVFISSKNFGVDENNALHSFCHADGSYHLMGCMLSAASCNKWWAEEILQTKDFAAEQAPIQKLGENHVFFLPYLMGERSPHNNPDARGVFFGMSMDSTRADMTQAVLEGVAFGLRDSLEVARNLGIKIERTKICGGGAKSPLWKKIIANVMNLKVDVLENEEGPSMGGAMLAAVGCGAYPDVETIGKKFAKVVDTVEPDPELVAKYEERYQKFRTLYPAMKPLF